MVKIVPFRIQCPKCKRIIEFDLEDLRQPDAYKLYGIKYEFIDCPGCGQIMQFKSRDLLKG